MNSCSSIVWSARGLALALFLCAAPRAAAEQWGALEQARLTGAQAGAGLGADVAVDGDVLAATGVGQVRVYERAGSAWTLAHSVTRPSPFGSAVEVSGGTVAVAEAHPTSGVAYVYASIGGVWLEEAAISGPTEAIALDGDTLVVGGGQAEAVRVYRRTGAVWGLEQELTAFDARPGFAFGTAFALDGDTLIVAAPGDASFYVFERAGSVWALVQKVLPASGPLASRITLEGDVAVIGTRDLFVFERSAGLWSQGQKLQPASGLLATGYGVSVGIDGDLIAVGASNDGTLASGAGVVYLFRRLGGTWQAPTHAVGSTTTATDGLGIAVDASGGRVVAGANGDDVGGSGTGSVFVFDTFDLIPRTQEQKLVAAGGQPGDRFGDAVALDGDTLLVGAQLEDVGGLDAGAAYVYRRGPGLPGTWTEEARLSASDAGVGAFFGCAVVVAGDLAVVGARGDDALATLSGAAYVFERTGTTWTETAKLLAPDGDFEDEFGTALALDGDRLVVGAPRETNTGAFRAGSAYVFERTAGTWTFRQKLRASIPDTMASFGEAVAVRGTTIAVGAFRQDNGDVGRVFVFEEGAPLWTEQATFVPTSSTLFRRFGAHLALGEDRLLVGAPGLEGGKLYVYTRTGTVWTERSETRPLLPASGNDFAASFAWDGERVVLGARGFGVDPGESGVGYAYALRPDEGLDFEALFVATVPRELAELGDAVALSGTTAVLGAPGHDGASPGSGAVFVYELGVPFPAFCDASDGALASCPCANPGLPDTGCDIAQSTGGMRLDVVAQETGATNRATLAGSGYPPASAPGVTVLRSTALDPSSPVVFGDGLRCIGVPVVRVGATLGAGGTSVQTVGHGAGAGAGTFYYQLWVRNTPVMFCDPTAAFNLSNGRAIAW